MPTILTKKSDTPGAIPATANLTNAAGGAELAVNTADKRLFTITSGSQVVELGTNPASLTCADVSATVLRAGSATITNLIATTATVSDLSATVARISSLTISSLSLSNATFGSATITNLTSTSATISSALTLTGGTANGVLYLNGSKVATSGSALTFDGGANLSTGGSNASTYNTLNVNNTASNGFSRLLFNIGTSGANGTAAIKYAPGVFFAIGPDANDTTTPIVFNLNNATEQMRLTSTGLGIGTSSPAVKLDVVGGINAAKNQSILNLTSASGQSGFTTITNSSGVTYVGVEGTGGGSSFTGATANASIVGSGSTNPLQFITNATVRATLDSSGNLGIGTSSPACGLEVSNSGNGSVGEQARITSTDTESKLAFVNTGGNGAITQSSGAMIFQTNTANTERMRLDAAGNLGLGVTPSAWSGGKALQVKNTSNPVFMSETGGDGYFGYNAYYNGTNWIYVGSYYANALKIADGTFQFLTAASGTAGNTISFTQAMTLDASGNLGVGTSSPAYRLDVAGPAGSPITLNLTSANSNCDITMAASGSSAVRIRNNVNDLQFHTNGSQRATITSGGEFCIGTTAAAISNAMLTVYNPAATSAHIFLQNTTTGTGNNGARLLMQGNDLYVTNKENAPMIFETNDTERARITAAGELLVNTTSNTDSRTFKVVTSTGAEFNTGGTRIILAYALDNENFSVANAAMLCGRNAGTGRSINAGGTVNASGADYAEYMEKAGDFAIAKGDVCGIDANGKLTNIYDEAMSFVVKSTNPSYVGGDTWGVDYENDAEGLEAARQKVDRIAFAGQVPVNVLGATPGQYIVPINDNGAIKGMAVSNPSFEQYQAAVGKVIAIEDDGRARIIVKVA